MKKQDEDFIVEFILVLTLIPFACFIAFAVYKLLSFFFGG